MADTGIASQIEKSIQLNCPRHRVWRDLTTAHEFATWFGVKLEGEFTVGQPTRGKFKHEKYANATFEVLVETITPETRFTYRWRPFAMDEGVDYSAEPRTLAKRAFRALAGGARRDARLRCPAWPALRSHPPRVARS